MNHIERARKLIAYAKKHFSAPAHWRAEATELLYETKPSIEINDEPTDPYTIAVTDPDGITGEKPFDEIRR